jgi:hypothetical protein
MEQPKDANAERNAGTALPPVSGSASEGDYDYFDDGEPDRECPRCHGVGGDPMDDYCTPCDHCDGEGYEWWK